MTQGVPIQDEYRRQWGIIDYDLHIHTAYCGHADGMTVEAICDRLDTLNFSTAVIADHIFQPSDRSIIEKIRSEVAAISPQCRVYIGAEVDVDANYTDGRLVTDDLSGLDSVIAGFHYVPTVGNLPRSPEDNPLSSEAFMEVWASSLLGIVSNPKIDTLAHPGRLLAASVDLGVYFEDAMGVFEQAAELSAQNNIAWELNELTGRRLGAYWQQQWWRVYRVALDAGVKLVYGSDAHTPDAVGTHSFVDMLLRKLPKGCLAKPEEIIRL